MAIFSRKICEERLGMWLDAEAAIAAGQAYTMGTRSLTRANLKEVREELEYWGARLAECEAEETRGGINRIGRFVPRDV